MINVAAKKNSVTIVADSDHNIFGGMHRPFFETILGFEALDDGSGYELVSFGDIGEQIREVADYLEENQFDFELDPAAQQFLDDVAGTEQQFELAASAGKEAQADKYLAPPPIDGFKRPLLPHQYLSVRHLIAVPNAANFSVPGAGKTTIVLAAFQHLRNAGEVDCLLVIGPGSSFLAWEEEFTDCFARRPTAVRLSGSPEERQVAYARARRAELILVTYHTANNDRQRITELLRYRSALLVLDESHYVKGSGPLAEAVLDVSPAARRRIILTGTPMPNGYRDLWTQASFLWPRQNLFGNRIQFNTLLSSNAGQDQAKAKMRPFFTRVRKSDLPLPEQKYYRVPVKMGPQQQRIYDILAARTLNEISLLPNEKTVVRQWRKAKMIRLLQAASNPALLTQESIEFSLPPEDTLDLSLLQILENFLRYEMPTKVLAAVQLVRRILDDPEHPEEKVVIWTHFVRNIELLLELLSPDGPLPLYGAVPREGPDDDEYTREQHIKAFRTDKNCRVLIANPGAAAESISLHKVAHHAIYLDRTFNAGQFIQSRDRIHRVGLRLDENVTYHLLMSEGSIDQTIDARLQLKEQRMMDVLDDPDVPATSLEISTNHISGPNEQEEELDFMAVIDDLRRRVHR